MFVIRMATGEEVHYGPDDKLTVDTSSGVLKVERQDRHEDVTIHLSPISWWSVTEKTKH